MKRLPIIAIAWLLSLNCANGQISEDSFRPYEELQAIVDRPRMRQIDTLEIELASLKAIIDFAPKKPTALQKKELVKSKARQKEIETELTKLKSQKMVIPRLGLPAFKEGKIGYAISGGKFAVAIAGDTFQSSAQAVTIDGVDMFLFLSEQLKPGTKIVLDMPVMLSAVNGLILYSDKPPTTSR